jgi:peptidoglycan/xylan/chitin deacetylase (PgdA/CDA1 family)
MRGLGRIRWGVMRLKIVLPLALMLAPGLAHGAECAYTPQQTQLSRVVAVDSANGPVYDPQTGKTAPQAIVLKDHELILTFDGGPHPVLTKYILDILDKHCVKATFFFSGRAALTNPKVVREVMEHGNTIAAGPWSVSPPLERMAFEDAKAEAEKGLAAVTRAAGAPIAPFFRFPAGRGAPELPGYLAARNISVWSFDLASGDLEPGATATKIANRTLARINELGKGVIEFHDTKVTVDALDSILDGAKHDGFKFVHVVQSTNFVPLDEYASKVAAVAATVAHPSPVSQHLVSEARRRVRSSNGDDQRTQRIAPKRAREEQTN